MKSMKLFVIGSIGIVLMWLGIAIAIHVLYQATQRDYNACIDNGGTPHFCLTGFK